MERKTGLEEAFTQGQRIYILSYLGDEGQGKPGQLNKTLSQNQKGKNKRAIYGYSLCMYVCMYTAQW